MSFAEAAVTVLEAAGTPLHYKDITQRALCEGLIQTEGKTPDATLNAILAVDIKKKGSNGRFVRVRPGVFGLRSWSIDESLPAAKPVASAEEERRVRVPLFPLYSEVRLVLQIWDGVERSQITGLRSTLKTLWGSPQAPEDWTNPDTWISQRLQGDDRKLAQSIWQKTELSRGL